VTLIPGVEFGARSLGHFGIALTRRTRGFADFDGVEIWNLPLSVANVVSRPGGGSGEERALAQADAYPIVVGRSRSGFVYANLFR
jgi:hypothetical protein